MEEEELTPLQKLDQQYKQNEQAKLIAGRDFQNRVKDSIPNAFDLNSERPVGLEVGLGTKYDVGMYESDLVDRAEFNAQNQTTADKWKNASIKMSNIASTVAVTGIPSFVLGVADLTTGGEDGEYEFSDLWNNAVANAASNWIESLEDIQQFPNLKTREEQEMGLGEKLGTANFWADGLMKNAGYAMGMVASGYATGAIFSAINAAKITEGVAEALVSAGKYSTIDDATIAIAKGLESKAVRDGITLASKANKNKTALQSYANTSFSSFGEATQEAVSSRNEIYKKLSLEHPNMSEEEKNAIAEKGGNAALVWNMALLSITNTRQLKGAISSFDGAKTTLNKIALNAETGLYKDATKKSLEVAKKVGSGLLSEGSEEQLQLAGAAASEDYYIRVANGDVEGMTTIAKSIGEGLSKAYGTQEGWENFVTGAVLGFTGVPTVGKYKNGYVGPKMAGGVYDEIKGVQESADETASAVDKVNSVIQSDSFKNRYNNTVVSSSYEEDKTKSKTEFDFNNAESNQFIFDAETFIDAGLYSEFKEQLESVKNTDITTLRKQFDKAGVYKSLDDKELKEVVDRETEYKVSKLDAIRDLKKDISRQFPNASSDYKTQLLQYGAIVNDVESRIELLSSTIGKHNSYIQGVYDATNEVLKLQSDKAISKKDNTDSTEIDTALEEANKTLEEAMAKGSPLDVKKAESITKELESLYERRTKFGIKYLEGFGIEFQEEVDNTIKDSRTAKEEEILRKQQEEEALRRDAEYNATLNGDNDPDGFFDRLMDDEFRDLKPEDNPSPIVVHGGANLNDIRASEEERLAAQQLSDKITSDIDKVTANKNTANTAIIDNIGTIKNNLDINTYINKEVQYQKYRGRLVRVNDSRYEIHTTSNIVEIPLEELELVMPVIEKARKEYLITDVTENSVIVNGEQYTINTDNKGNIISLSNINSANKEIKNNKLIVAVEIARNKLELLSTTPIDNLDSKLTTIDTSTFPVSKILSNIWDTNYTESIDNSLDNMLNDVIIGDDNVLEVAVWLSDVFKTLEKYINATDKTKAQKELFLEAYRTANNIDNILFKDYNISARDKKQTTDGKIQSIEQAKVDVATTRDKEQIKEELDNKNKESVETAPIAEQAPITPEVVTPIVTPKVTKINTDGFINEDDAINQGITDTTFVQNIVPNPNIDIVYESEAFEQVSNENTEPLTTEYEATPQVKTDTSKTVQQEDHYDEVTDREIEEELKKEELFKEAKKQEDASDSISVFNQEFKRKESNLNYVQATSNDLAAGTNMKMLDPTNFPIGTKVEFRVEDIDSNPVYDKGTNIIVSWGALKSTLSPSEIALYVPIAIYAGNEKLGYVHTDSFINPLNVVPANIPSSREKLAKIRKSILETKVNATGTIIERGNGALKFEKDREYGKLSERSPKGKLEIVEGKLALVIPRVSDTLSIFTKRTKVLDSKNAGDIKNTVIQALAYYFTGGNPQNINSTYTNSIQKVANEYGYKLTKYEDLVSFLKIYINPQVNSSGNFSKTTANRQGESGVEINHAFGINKNTDGTIDFKLVNRNEAKDYLSYNKRDGVAESELGKITQLQYDFLTALEPVISNLYINVNAELKENNKVVYVLKEDGTIGSLSKDYDSFLRDNNTTNLSPVTEKDKEYYVVNPILKFSLDESVKPVTPTDPKGTTDNSGISDKAKRASKLFKNAAERPFESTDKQVERTRDIVSNTIILGLRPELQGEVVDSIIGEVGKTFVTKKNNISVEEASEPVFNELQDSYNLLNEIIVDEKELMATGVSKVVMQTRIDNIKLVLDNKEMILRLADAKMKQSSIFQEDNFEEEEDDNSELDKVEFSRSTYSENPIDKISIEVKKLLTGIIEIDSSGEAVTNWFGYDKVYDYKPIYEQVQTMSLGLDPDINLIVENLNKKVDSFPWIKQVVDRIVNADGYIQNKLVKNLTGHENKMNYVQHSKYEGQTVYTIVDANDNGVKQVLLREWDSNLRNSRAYNVTTGEFDPTYYRPLIEEYRSWKETPDAKTLIDWLSKFGITTKEETITRIVAEFEEGNKNPLTDPSSVIYNMSVFAASTQKNILNIDSSNPLKKSSVIKFAEETATDSIEITARSFRTGGKVVQASGTNCYLVNRFRNLKRSLKLLNRTRKVPFNKDSFILNELSKDAAFRKTFSYFTMALDAFKDKEGKTNKEGEMTKRSEGEIEAIKIAEFQALRNKVRSYQTIGGKKIESKYANFLFMTTSDKPTVRGMTTKLFPIEIDTTGRPTVDTFHFLFDQLIRPEINRINQIHAFNEGKNDPNVAQPNSKDYLEAGKIFYFIPELNNADFIWSNKATGKLDPFIADPNSDIYARVVNEYLKPQLIAEVDAKVKLWKESGIGFSADGKFPFLDAKYMNNIVLPQAEGESLANYVNRKVRVAAIDMTMQYKVAYANQFGTFFSDPANYFKGNFKKSAWENVMSTWDNIAKRLAGASAPRMEFQHPDKNIKYMFVTDPRTASYNMDGVKDQSDKDQSSYSEQKEADAQEWITLSEKIGNMMANGDIKTNGLGKHIREVIAREVAKDNFDYMDVLEDSIESKFGEDGLKEFKSFVYQPEKPVYYGTSIDSKTNLENVLYVKSSAMVMLPSGSPAMNKLRAIAEKNGVQRIVTSTTATKLGAVKDVLDPWVYTDGHVTDINEKLLAQDVSTSTLTVSREGWGIQLEKQYDADSHEINKVSQAAKNFINGMLEVGGFEINGEFMDGDAVRDHFNRINKQIYESQYNALLKELDAVVDESGNILSIDVNKIRNMLIKEGIEKGYNIIELETFMLDPELSGITFAPNAGKIEPLLNSMVSNNVLKIKMFGKGLTLGAETMYVGDLSKSKIITTDSWTGRLLPSRVVKESTTDSFAMFKSALEKVCD